MNILYVLPFYYPLNAGGAEVSSREYAVELSKHFNMFVVTPNFGSFKGCVAVDNGVKVVKFAFPFKAVKGVSYLINTPFFGFYAAFQIFKVIKKYNIDIVHVQSSLCFFSGILASLLANRTCVVTVRDHGFELSFNHFKMLWAKSRVAFVLFSPFQVFDFVFRRALLKRVSLVLAVSKYMKKRFESNITGVKTIVLYNTAQDIFFLRKLTRGGHIGFFGSLNKEKGVGLLLESMQFVNGKLHLFGNSNVQYYKSLADRLGVKSKVVFHGRISHSEILGRMAECSVVVVPSLRDEPLSRNIIEAFSLGKPVVATDTGGSGEFVNSKTGVLVKSLTPDAFGNGIRLMLSRIKSFDGRYNRQLARNFFNMRSNSVLLKKTYEGLA